MGAEISGQPIKLASALAKLQAAARHIRNPDAEANPAAASLYIVPPGLGGVRDNLFSTHPAAENRIAALEAMAGASGSRPGASAVSPWPVHDQPAVRKPSALGLNGNRETGKRDGRYPWG
jgi:heat shock protein HtpX